MRMISKTRRVLYRTASVLGDINAVSKGPAPAAKRVIRKSAWRAFSRAMRGL